MDGKPADAPLRIQLLGPLRAFRHDDELDLGATKQRAVLAVLALAANRPVSVESIVDAVWRDDPPSNGANVVQKHIAGLRRILEPERSPRSPGQLLALTDAGYQLNLDPTLVDTTHFANLLYAARAERSAHRPEQAAHRITQALVAFRGEPLAGLPGSYFDAERERLRSARADAGELRAELLIELGRPADALPELSWLVESFPAREQPRYLMMLALYRCGRQAEALAGYRQAHEYLAEEYAVLPGERLRTLHQQILRDDPTLTGGEAAPEPAGHPVARRASALPTAALPQLPVAAGPRRSRQWLLGRIAIAIGLDIVCVCSIGFISWIPIAALAMWRRSWWLAGSAVVYFLLFVTAMATSDINDDIMMTAVVIAAVGSALQVWPVLLRQSNERPVRRTVLVQQVRRQQAREVVTNAPTTARELRIGRPDLPRWFDDGFLVDVNSAPAALIATLPGIPLDRAHQIVASRITHGPVSTIDDLVYRMLITPKMLHKVRDMLVVVPPTGDPSAAGRR